MAEFELKALITGVDRLSPGCRKCKRKSGDLNARRKRRHGWAGAWWRIGSGADAFPEIFADQENAATGLKVAMMDANGGLERAFRTSINWLLAWVTSYRYNG